MIKFQLNSRPASSSLSKPSFSSNSCNFNCFHSNLYNVVVYILNCFNFIHDMKEINLHPLLSIRISTFYSSIPVRRHPFSVYYTFGTFIIDFSLANTDLRITPARGINILILHGCIIYRLNCAVERPDF